MRRNPAQQTLPMAVPPPGSYEIDADSSVLAFTTRHLFGLAPVRGTFRIRGGTVEITGPLSDSMVHVEVETASFRTGNPRRDANVRSRRLLDTGRYPVMTFASERLSGLALVGTLTVGPETRPVRLTIDRSRVSGAAFTAHATTRIDRAEFGVSAYRGLAGRYLHVDVEVRCVRV
ncbi:YceI family protein [Nonomuraea rubra]|uniref:YceI family protein n=1 Tax=Nonomuraea rubra TaxID=46180 RepID=UPI0033CC8C1B